MLEKWAGELEAILMKSNKFGNQQLLELKKSMLKKDINKRSDEGSNFKQVKTKDVDEKKA